MKPLLQITILLQLLGTFLFAQPFAPPSTCEDSLAGTATVVPKLDSPFFRQSQSSYHWWMVEDDAGNLEDTTDGSIDGGDLLKMEHTARCLSTHQGEHRMDFCEATVTADGVELDFNGGIPAYASSLVVTVDAKLNFKCAFSAVYPNGTNALKWKITRKEMKVKSSTLAGGTRLYGWISVSFEETDTVTRATKVYKIEGYFKPVVQHKP